MTTPTHRLTAPPTRPPSTRSRAATSPARARNASLVCLTTCTALASRFPTSAADVDAQKKYVALRALGVKRDLALDAVGATEGATFKAAFAYVLARLKYGSGVDLIFQGDAVGPTNTAAQGAARKRSLLTTAVDAGRKLLATATNPVLAFVGDTTKTTATYNGFTVEPPDQGLCAGGGWVIEATNVVISIRNQNTPATVAANFPKSLCNFYRGVSGDTTATRAASSFRDPMFSSSRRTTSTAPNPSSRSRCRPL